MNLKVCDVCYYEREEKPMPRDGVKITPATHRIAYKKKSINQRMALDVCQKHRDYFKTCITFDEAQKKVEALYGI